MRVRYTARAAQDLHRIYAYLEERDSHAALAVITRIQDRVSRLADYPFMGPRTSRDPIRSLNVPPYPYKVYYRVGFNEVAVLHIRHGRRFPWLGAPQ